MNDAIFTVVVILRTFDLNKVKEFWCRFLGFKLN